MPVFRRKTGEDRCPQSFAALQSVQAGDVPLEVRITSERSITIAFIGQGEPIVPEIGEHWGILVSSARIYVRISAVFGQLAVEVDE
jgi:hypothetical protein